MASEIPKARLVLGVGVLLVLVALWLRTTGAVPPDTGGPVIEGEATRATDGGAAKSATSTRRVEHGLGVAPAVKDAEAAEYLREQFGATIDSKRSQIKALEKLIGYLMKTYPEDWEERIQALLAQAFPGLATELYAQYQNMSAYNEWLKASQAELAAMLPGDKRDAIRDARFRFFGADAAEIWEEALRNERIYDAMDAIDQDSAATVDQKLASYVDAINESYGEDAPQFLEKRQTELLTKFLALPSVQSDLHSMSIEDRQGQLEQVRSSLGMDEAALERWRELDAQRDQAWENGTRYMEKREEITSGWQGEEQARRLEQLRVSMLGVEAESVREEEASGFFRFGHPRVFGKE